MVGEGHCVVVAQASPSAEKRVKVTAAWGTVDLADVVPEKATFRDLVCHWQIFCFRMASIFLPRA